MPVLPADEASLRQAGELLRQGRLVAFPTETVYGLGADATNGRAVATIFEAKGRPRFNPLIVHVAGIAAADEIAILSALARTLARAFWPGPLTLVARRKPSNRICDLVTAGLDTVAIRVPAHPVAQAIIAAADRPVAAPSANRSGHVSATTAAHVAADLGDAPALIIDGGPTTVGVESTIVDATGEALVLLRSGGVPASEIERIAGQSLARASDPGSRPSSPGQLASHYAPTLPMRLAVTMPREGEALLAFGPLIPVHSGPILNLSPSGDLREAAANLFGAIRALDATGATGICVMPIPEEGLGEAINDRLRRAAAPRG